MSDQHGAHTSQKDVLEDLHTPSEENECDASTLPPLREWNACYDSRLHRVVFSLTTDSAEWTAVAHSYEYTIICHPRGIDADIPFKKIAECKIGPQFGIGHATNCIAAELTRSGYIAE